MDLLFKAVLITLILLLPYTEKEPVTIMMWRSLIYNRCSKCLNRVE